MIRFRDSAAKIEIRQDFENIERPQTNEAI